jgi:branched-chain amino acid transport system ATP-binding protein
VRWSTSTSVKNMLRIRNLVAGYGKLNVFKGLSLHVNPGEIVTIIGANGAGKSTLLHAIAGLIGSTSGSIQLSGTEIRGMPPEAIVALGCSLVPEGRQMFATMTVWENLLLGGYLSLKKNRRKAAQRLDRIFQIFPILTERKSQHAGTLSGGEQQMLAIARSLMSEPKLVMMDEPSMGLAPLIVRDIFAIIEKLRVDGKTILLIEQNARAALKIANRGYVMETGAIVLEGSSEELLSNPDVQRAYLGKDYKRINE